MSLLDQLPPVTTQKGWPWDTEVSPNHYKGKHNWPKISIVTPSYNQGHFIEETIRSILLQNYPNLEYIVIDGGSSDETVAILKKYEKWITNWVSEKDAGQADAINKGIKMCTGEVFNWINSDDRLPTNCLLYIGQLFKKNHTVAGKVKNFYHDDPRFSDIIENKELEVDRFLALKSNFHQPGIWCDLQNVIETGAFSVSSRYYFDRIFFTEYFRRYPDIIYTHSVLVHFRYHEESKTVVIKNDHVDELIDFYKRLLKNPEYDQYRPYIRQALLLKLLPEKYINTWEVDNQHNLAKRKLKNYFVLALRKPYLLISRYYYTKLKKAVPANLI